MLFNSEPTRAFAQTRPITQDYCKSWTINPSLVKSLSRLVFLSFMDLSDIGADAAAVTDDCLTFTTDDLAMQSEREIRNRSRVARQIW